MDAVQEFGDDDGLCDLVADRRDFTPREDRLDGLERVELKKAVGRSKGERECRAGLRLHESIEGKISIQGSIVNGLHLILWNPSAHCNNNSNNTSIKDASLWSILANQTKPTTRSAHSPKKITQTNKPFPALSCNLSLPSLIGVALMTLLSA